MTCTKDEVTQLLVQFKNNHHDKDALTRVYKIMRTGCVIFAKSHMRGTHIFQNHDDAVSRTFLKIIQKIDTFTEHDNGSAWIFQIIKNECKQILREEKKHNLAPIEASIPDNKDYLALAIGNIYKEEFFAQLDELDKQVLVLSIQGYKGEEIADIINKSLSTVRRIQSKTRILMENLGKEA